MTARQKLPFTSPYLLAPMQGVTEPSFRERVLERNGPGALGGTFTEFCRVVRTPLPRRVLSAHLGEKRFPQPVGLQLMGSDAQALAQTAARAVEISAPLIDLNFGCPAKGALRGCAGAALLDEPARVEELVGTVRKAIGEETPLSAKIRAGGEDDRNVEALARAVEGGGADLLIVHARTRREGYGVAADWRRLERAVGAVSIPVCGNGGIHEYGDLERLRRTTGCALAMVGRAALADPWIFSGGGVSRGEAARFLIDYAAGLMDRGACALESALRRVKQLLKHWTAGGLVTDENRLSWLREENPEALMARLERALEGEEIGRNRADSGELLGDLTCRRGAQREHGRSIRKR